MKKAIRKMMIVLFALVFIGSAGMMLYTDLQRDASAAAQAEAQAVAAIPSVQELPQEAEAAETHAPADDHAALLAQTDLAALREVNPDVLGWISIPNTGIGYPLMDGEDNDFYLNHTWKKEANAAGSIFLEQQNSSDLVDFNTILYGHRMRDGSMFAGLKYYDDSAYRDAHPYVYIAHDGGCDRYEIFAAYQAPIGTRTYQYAFADEAQRQAFIDHALSATVIDTGVTPDADDRILTLVTCTGSGYESRWVVQAVLRQ